eukprot:Hpha_TRINITY_DN8254_c0_g1::TRINITY_DN8254_c0_g1_i1::g.112047::m.112047
MKRVVFADDAASCGSASVSPRMERRRSSLALFTSYFERGEKGQKGERRGSVTAFFWGNKKLGEAEAAIKIQKMVRGRLGRVLLHALRAEAKRRMFIEGETEARTPLVTEEHFAFQVLLTCARQQSLRYTKPPPADTTPSPIPRHCAPPETTSPSRDLPALPPGRGGCPDPHLPQTLRHASMVLGRPGQRISAVASFNRHQVATLQIEEEGERLQVEAEAVRGMGTLGEHAVWAARHLAEMSGCAEALAGAAELLESGAVRGAECDDVLSSCAKALAPYHGVLRLARVDLPPPLKAVYRTPDEAAQPLTASFGPLSLTPTPSSSTLRQGAAVPRGPEPRLRSPKSQHVVAPQGADLVRMMLEVDSNLKKGPTVAQRPQQCPAESPGHNPKLPPRTVVHSPSVSPKPESHERAPQPRPSARERVQERAPQEAAPPPPSWTAAGPRQPEPRDLRTSSPRTSGGGRTLVTPHVPSVLTFPTPTRQNGSFGSSRHGPPPVSRPVPPPSPSPRRGDGPVSAVSSAVVSPATCVSEEPGSGDQEAGSVQSVEVWIGPTVPVRDPSPSVKSIPSTAWGSASPTPIADRLGLSLGALTSRSRQPSGAPARGTIQDRGSPKVLSPPCTGTVKPGWRSEKVEEAGVRFVWYADEVGGKAARR